MRPGPITVRTMQRRLRRSADPVKARLLLRFFKTGPGEYGEGDRFLGIMVPDIRRAVQEFREAPLSEIRRLLRSPFHEERLLALLILVRQYERMAEARRIAIYSLYLRSVRFINNWDLVDLTAPHIVGAHLKARSRRPLYVLARSKDLWKRRIAVLATFSFIRDGHFDDALAIAGILLADEEDLIHKATGWMLREVGKRDQRVLEGFLGKHCRSMPRTMLRYAIERFPHAKRLRYLNGLASGRSVTAGRRKRDSLTIFHGKQRG